MNSGRSWVSPVADFLIQREIRKIPGQIPYKSTLTNSGSRRRNGGEGRATAKQRRRSGDGGDARRCTERRGAGPGDDDARRCDGVETTASKTTRRRRGDGGEAVETTREMTATATKTAGALAVVITPAKTATATATGRPTLIPCYCLEKNETEKYVTWAGPLWAGIHTLDIHLTIASMFAHPWNTRTH